MESTTMAQTILLVDDEAKLRDMLRVYFEQEGYRVVEAGHGREARPDHSRPDDARDGRL
jgi:DNA-binding response OmpR family regulator